MRLGAVSILVLAAATSSHAQLVIDDFTSGSAHFSKSAVGATYTSQLGSMIGLDRTEGLNILTDPFSTPLNVDAGSGFLSYSEGSGVASNVSLGYGYTASADGSSVSTFNLGLDLTKFNAFDLTMAFDGASMPVTIELNNDPTKSYEFTVSPRSVSTDYVVGFNLFSGVDFSERPSDFDHVPRPDVQFVHAG